MNTHKDFSMAAVPVKRKTTMETLTINIYTVLLPKNQTSVYSHLPIYWKYRKERNMLNKTTVIQGAESQLGEIL